MTVTMICKHRVMTPSWLFFFLITGYSHETGRNLCKLQCVAMTGVSLSLGAEWVHNRKKFGKVPLRV